MLTTCVRNFRCENNPASLLAKVSEPKSFALPPQPSVQGLKIADVGPEAHSVSSVTLCVMKN